MYNVTYHGLHNWSKAMFEKLGWMVLAHAHGHQEIVETYLINIGHLMKAIEERKRNLEEKNRKNDMDILMRNMDILKNFVTNNLGKKGPNHKGTVNNKNKNKVQNKNKAKNTLLGI